MIQPDETLLLSRSRPSRARSSKFRPTVQAAPLSLPAPICDSADGGALNPDILPLSGASFVVKAYDGMAMGDCITFRFNIDGPGEYTDYHDISQKAVGVDQTFAVPKANIDSVVGDYVMVDYILEPADNSDPVISDPLYLFVGTLPLLAKPRVDEASDGHLNAEFAQLGAHVVIPEYDDMSSGDVIYMYWGDDTEAGFYNDAIKVRAARETTFLVPPENVAAYLDESVNIRYDVGRGDVIRPSSIFRLRIGNAVDDTKPPAPEIQEAISSILNPDLVPNGATALVGPNDSLQSGDMVKLTWGGGLPKGQQWEFFISDYYTTHPYPQHIPYDKITPFIDDVATLVYEIEQEGDWQISNVLTVKVERSIAEVAPPYVPQAVQGGLDPRDVLPGVGLSVSVPMNPHVLPGDALRLTWDCENPEGSWDSEHQLRPDDLEQSFEFRVPFGTLILGLESRINVSYEIVRNGNIYASSSSLRLNIRQGNLPAPSIRQADLDKLNPADCPAGATVLLNASGKFRNGDKITLNWTDTDGGNTFPIKHTVADYESGGTIDVIVPLDTVKANAPYPLTLDYTVERASGTPEERSLPAVFDVVTVPGHGQLLVMGARSTNHSHSGERQPDRLYAFNNDTLKSVEAQWIYEDEGDGTSALGTSFKDTRPWVPLRVRTQEDSVTINPGNISATGSVSAAQGAAFVSQLNGGNVINWGDPNWGASETATIMTLDDVVEVSATAGAFAVRRSTGRIAAWGNPQYGGEIPAGLSSEIKDARRIIGNGTSFAVLHATGRVTVWGSANNGGIAPQTIKELTNIEEIFHAESAFAALLKTREVVAWGDPQKGGTVSEDILGIDDIVDVRGNSFAFCALRDNGHVLAWGDKDNGGQVPDRIADRSDIIELAAAGERAFAVRTKDKQVLAWGNVDFGGKVPDDIASLNDIEAVTASSTAFAALRGNGHVVAWGEPNNGGKVKDEIAELHDIVQIASTTGAFAALRTTGEVVVWGNETKGGDTSAVTARLKNVRAIYGNSQAFAAICADGGVVTWGVAAGGGESTQLQMLLKDGVTYQATAAVRGRMV